MRTESTTAAEEPRTLTRVIEDAIGLLTQDASEYAFIGFIGAAGALFGGVVLRLVHNPIADAMIVPVVLLTALLTMAASSVAFVQASENLHPEAGLSIRTAIGRSSSFVRPWLMLFAMLFAASLAVALFAPVAGWWGATALALLLLAWPALYTLPRGYYFAVLLTQQMPERDAENVSSTLFWRAPRRAIAAWAVALTPAIAVSLIGLATGFGAFATGIAAFVFVACMPLAATVNGLLFFDAAAQAKRGAASSSPPRAAQRPASTYGAVSGSAASRRGR